MKQSASIENWYIKSVYLEYLNTCCPQRTIPLSHDTILIATVNDEQPWYSITATDIQTKQVMTIDNDGLVERYTLRKTA